LHLQENIDIMNYEMPLSFNDNDLLDDVFFDSDDPDFVNPNGNVDFNIGPLRNKMSQLSVSSSRSSIGDEHFAKRSGLHPRSYPVLIPNRNINTNCIMRQSEVKTASAPASPNCTQWYSERGVMTLDDIRNQHHNTQTMLTIEELKSHYNSCFTCGVSWTEDHVSLDCFECGGYSMQRPCPVCDGKCESTFRRDLAMSHAMRKACWEGECGHGNLQQEQLLLNLVDDCSLTESLQKKSLSS
jgi:hypothetical protein